MSGPLIRVREVTPPSPSVPPVGGTDVYPVTPTTINREGQVLAVEHRWTRYLRRRHLGNLSVGEVDNNPLGITVGIIGKNLVRDSC